MGDCRTRRGLDELLAPDPPRPAPQVKAYLADPSAFAVAAPAASGAAPAAAAAAPVEESEEEEEMGFSLFD
jgi:large subunit ribosomal protein LP0